MKKHEDINHVEHKDPVCKMKVSRLTAPESLDYYGKTYYFCSSTCRITFEQDPEKYT